MRRGSSRGGGSPTSMWRPTRRAHLLRCLSRASLRRGRATSQSALPSAPRIWTLLVGLPRPRVVLLILCASFAASLALAAAEVFAQGDANAGKGVYERKC